MEAVGTEIMKKSISTKVWGRTKFVFTLAERCLVPGEGEVSMLTSGEATVRLAC